MNKTVSETFASPAVPYFPAERLLAYRVAREVLAEVARVSRGGRRGARCCGGSGSVARG
jgi:hypothetical protein